MPCLRVNCATATPASPSFRIATICDSLNRDFFIGLPSSAKSCQKSPVLAVYREGKLTAQREADMLSVSTDGSRTPISAVMISSAKCKQNVMQKKQLTQSMALL